MNRSALHTIGSGFGIVGLVLIHPSCTGTEADNPFTDPTTTTACKSKNDYVPLAEKREALAINEESLDPKSEARLPARVSGLSSLSEIPVWLECLEWDLSGGILDYQIANFRGGCAIEWEGGARVGADAVTIELANPNCAVAGCGSCIYDTRSSGRLEVPAPESISTLDLILEDCEGEVTQKSSWVVPLGLQAHGLSCRKADRWGAESAAGNSSEALVIDLYAPCGDELFAESERSCADDLTCTNGACVPSCTSDEDCPLSGALSCQQGFCQLVE